MTVQTQVRGERCGPPTGRTAVGAADFAERTVLIALKDAREAQQLVWMYQKLGWRALTAGRKHAFFELVSAGRIDLVVTDRFRYLVAVRSFRRDGRVPPMHFIANDTTHSRVVFEAGVANWFSS